jgi:hypothetical protein
VIEYHYILTLQGGTANEPKVVTFSGTTNVDHGDSRERAFDTLVDRLRNSRNYRDSLGGAPTTVLFFSLEPDQLG